jgi:hypothetical protein
MAAPRSRIALLAGAADAVATAAPFGVGLVAAWATPMVRRDPAGLRAGAIAVACTAAIGLLLRAGFTGRLPLSFAVIATVSLAVLLLGWRCLAALVSRTAHRALH